MRQDRNRSSTLLSNARAPDTTSRTSDATRRLGAKQSSVDALRALAPLPRAPVPRPSRPQPRTPQPRWSRRHSAPAAHAGPRPSRPRIGVITARFFGQCTHLLGRGTPDSWIVPPTGLNIRGQSPYAERMRCSCDPRTGDKQGPHPPQCHHGALLPELLVRSGTGRSVLLHAAGRFKAAEQGVRPVPGGDGAAETPLGTHGLGVTVVFFIVTAADPVASIRWRWRSAACLNELREVCDRSPTGGDEALFRAGRGRRSSCISTTWSTSTGQLRYKRNRMAAFRRACRRWSPT